MIEIPNLNEIYVKIMDVVSNDVQAKGEDISVKKTIAERIEDYEEDKRQINLGSNFEKVIRFITQFLMKSVKGEFYDIFLNYLFENYSDLKCLQKINPLTLSNYLRSIGYRWPNEGPKVIIDSLDLLEKEFEYKIKGYLEIARDIDNIQTNYVKDPFLDIDGVGYKVRDLGLSIFLDDYIAIDTHIIRVSRRTGILLNSYLLNEKLTTCTHNRNDYLTIRKVLFETSKKCKISLGELDRAFWHFGRTICSAKKPKCLKCPIANICCKYRYKL